MKAERVQSLQRVGDITLGGGARSGAERLRYDRQRGRRRVPGAATLSAGHDYDGDGRPDITLFRPSTGHWFIVNSSTGNLLTRSWGTDTDILVPGTYVFDLRADIAVYRPSAGLWYILRSWENYTESYQWYFGISGDIPVPADYDGDRRTDLAVYRPSDGTWYIRRSSFGLTDLVAYQWGVSDDVRVRATTTGSKAEIAIYRPSAGAWFILLSSTDLRVIHLGGALTATSPVPADTTATIGRT